LATTLYGEIPKKLKNQSDRYVYISSLGPIRKQHPIIEALWGDQLKLQTAGYVKTGIPSMMGSEVQTIINNPYELLEI